jgi:hypothetical protein
MRFLTLKYSSHTFIFVPKFTEFPNRVNSTTEKLILPNYTPICFVNFSIRVAKLLTFNAVLSPSKSL